MSRAEEVDDEHKEDDSSEKNILPTSELEPVSGSDIKWIMTGMNMVAEDLKSMKEKKKQFEEILLGTTVPGKHQQKKSNQKAKIGATKKIKIIANPNLVVKASKVLILRTVVAVTMILLLPAVLRLRLRMFQIPI